MHPAECQYFYFKNLKIFLDSLPVSCHHNCEVDEMRLSEAIRLGAMMRPQAYNSDGKDGSCALRAASEALSLPEIAGMPREKCEALARAVSEEK